MEDPGKITIPYIPDNSWEKFCFEKQNILPYLRYKDPTTPLPCLNVLLKKISTCTISHQIPCNFSLPFKYSVSGSVITHLGWGWGIGGRDAI